MSDEFPALGGLTEADKFERLPGKKADELKEDHLKALKDLEELKES